MKKQLTAVLLVFVLLFTTTGCAAANTIRKLDAAEDRIEAKLDAAEDKLEDSLRKAVSPAPTAAPAQTMPEPAGVPTTPRQEPPAASEASRMLTEEQAQQIALDHLGFTADQVTRIRVQYETDDGIGQYDVEFTQGDWEYEFEIHAEDGRILSYDKDHKYD